MPRRRGRAEPTPGQALLERLEPWEAQHVLRELVSARPDVTSLAEEIARSLLKDVSCARVAEDVEEEVRSLDMGDLDAGATPFGYVEPAEAAWQALEEALQPFVEDLKRRIELGLEAEALEICKGIVLGLHRLHEGDEHDILAHAPDFPEEAAGDALTTWHRTRRRTGGKATSRRPEFPPDFVQENMPDWRTLIDRVLRRA
jgi:hypothetical protein